MGVEKEYKLGINAEIHLDGTEKFEQTITGIATALNKVSQNRGFEKYWKTQKDLIADVEKYATRYQQNMSDTSSQNALIKSVNALRAVGGDDIFKGMSVSIQEFYEQASKRAIDIAEAYSPERFKEAFMAFETLRSAGLETDKVLKVLSSGADVSNLTSQLQAAENEAAELKSQVIDLQNAMSNSESGKTIQALREQIGGLQRQISIMVYQSQREFEHFLDFANINPDNGLEALHSRWNNTDEIDIFKERVNELYRNIENGEMSAKQAVAAIKAEFSHLMDGTQGATLDDFFNSPKMQEFLTKFENMCVQIESLTQRIGENLASMFTEALNNPDISKAMSQGFQQATNAGGINNITELVNALTSKLGEVDGQSDNIIGDFKEILAIIDSIAKTDLTNLDYMTAAFESLKSIGNFNIDGKSLEQLRSALDAISQISNVSNLSYLKNLSLDGFKDLKISKASMNNLSEHLSILANLDIAKLQGLSNIDLRNFNDLHISKASMEALSSFLDKLKDISRYSNELNNIAQILQSSVSKIGQLQNAVNGQVGNVANGTVQASQELETATHNILSNFKSVTVEGVNSGQFEKEISKIVESAEAANKTIESIKVKTNTKIELVDENDISKGVKEVTRLDSAIVKYIDDAGRASTAVFEPRMMTDSKGDAETFWLNTSGNVTENYKQETAQIEKLMNDRVKKISSLTGKLNDVFQTAKNANIKNVLTDNHFNVLQGTYQGVIDEINDLNNVTSSNDLVQRVSNITVLIDNLKNAISGFKASDSHNSFTGKNIETQFNIFKSSAATLEQNLKSSGIVITDDLQDLLDRINSVVTQKFNPKYITSKIISELSDNIQMAQAKVKAIKAESSAEHKNESLASRKDAALTRLKGLEKQNEGITDFEHNINGAKVSLESLRKELENVANSEALTSLNSKITAFEQAFKVDNKDGFAELRQKAIDNTNKQLADLKNVNALNPNLYSQEYTTASQKIEEFNEKLRTSGMTQEDYKTKVEETINRLKLMSSTVLDLGKNLDNNDVKMQANKLVEQYYSGKKVDPNISTKGNVTTLTYQWEDERKKVQQLVLEYNNMTGALRQIGHAQKEVKKGTSVWKSLTESFKHLGKYLVTFGSFYRIIGWVKQGIGYVRDLDSALTEMRKVSDETVDSLKRFQKVSFDIADSIGSTAKAIQDSTSDFMKLGYSLNKASQLAKDANVYANVGDMDIDTATEHMISSIKAWESEFKNEVEASTAIVDRYNEIGNNFAISSADIGSAMERSAAALKAGGNTLNEALGLITAGNLIQQDADTTANALKVLSLRIRGSKTELEDMGESTDDLADSTSKLRGEIKALTGVDIMLDDDTYKSTAQIIKEIGAVWDKLTDVQQANVLEKLAGKTRASVIAGLMENYDVIDEVMNSAENADGSATEENQKYLDSIEGKINQLTNHVQEFWSTLLESENVKKVIDILDFLVQQATKFVDSWAFTPTIIAGIAAALTKLKGGGRAKLS